MLTLGCSSGVLGSHSLVSSCRMVNNMSSHSFKGSKKWVEVAGFQSPLQDGARANVLSVCLLCGHAIFSQFLPQDPFLT